MTMRQEHVAGESAPKGGIYELLNVAGTSVGERVQVDEGGALPPAPLDWTWRLATEIDEP